MGRGKISQEMRSRIKHLHRQNGFNLHGTLFAINAMFAPEEKPSRATVLRTITRYNMDGTLRPESLWCSANDVERDENNNGSAAVGSLIASWSVQDVVAFVRRIPGCGHYARQFEERQIDGPTLLTLDKHKLMQDTGMPLGVAIRIVGQVEIMEAMLRKTEKPTSTPDRPTMFVRPAPAERPNKFVRPAPPERPNKFVRPAPAERPTKR